MLTLIGILFLGIVVGILTGLLPALPAYTGPFLLYYFGTDLPLEYLMTFWLAVVTGSQFFGSVATITTKIPGEESSTLYLRDIDSLTQSQKNNLLYDTALGSFVAGIISLLAVYVFLHFVNLTSVPFLGSIGFQIICYTLAVISFAFFNKNVFVTLVLILIGLALGPKNNYALPSTWFDLTSIFQGYTFYMLVLGVIIIPEVFLSDTTKASVNEQFVAVRSKMFSMVQGLKSSVIGLFAGLIPGPSAFLAALAAYKTAGKDTSKKIVAAETANNASVITCILPLLLFALPINQNTLIFSNIMDIRSVTITEAIWADSFIPGLAVIDLVVLSVAVSMVLYFWLSTHLIDFYSKFIDMIHTKMKIIMFVIISLLIMIDLSSADITAINYILLLTGFTVFGLVLKKLSINALPFLFSVILGDKIIWLYIQYYMINFS